MPQQVRLQQVERAHHQALAAYRPDPYPGDVALFRTPLRRRREDATLGWAETVEGRIDVHTLPGHHHDFIDQPELAQRFAACVAVVQAVKQ